jgi:hypothetical protein
MEGDAFYPRAGVILFSAQRLALALPIRTYVPNRIFVPNRIVSTYRVPNRIYEPDMQNSMSDSDPRGPTRPHRFFSYEHPVGARVPANRNNKFLLRRPTPKAFCSYQTGEILPMS